MERRHARWWILAVIIVLIAVFIVQTLLVDVRLR